MTIGRTQIASKLFKKDRHVVNGYMGYSIFISGIPLVFTNLDAFPSMAYSIYISKIFALFLNKYLKESCKNDNVCYSSFIFLNDMQKNNE